MRLKAAFLIYGKSAITIPYERTRKNVKLLKNIHSRFLLHNSNDHFMLQENPIKPKRFEINNFCEVNTNPIFWLSNGSCRLTKSKIISSSNIFGTILPILDLFELNQAKSKFYWAMCHVAWKMIKKNDPFCHINMATTLQETQIRRKFQKLHPTITLIFLWFKYLEVVRYFIFIQIHEKFASFLYKNFKMCHSDKDSFV